MTVGTTTADSWMTDALPGLVLDPERISKVPVDSPHLPWSSSDNERRRFQNSATAILYTETAIPRGPLLRSDFVNRRSATSDFLMLSRAARRSTADEDGGRIAFIRH
jgi:hypothetical protein